MIVHWIEAFGNLMGAALQRFGVVRGLMAVLGGLMLALLIVGGLLLAGLVGVVLHLMD